ncbi:unnamed protein product [Amoebophrya sp. A120]|nr:unnamed protein product [Amoebophrya sp. A120]|eukprot:GSA120T00005954001.1
MLPFSVEIDSVDFKFSSAHFVAFRGFRERLHGHNYTVKVRLEGNRVNHDGYVLDFGDVKTVTKQVCKALNEYVLLPYRSDVLKIRVPEDGVDHDQAPPDAEVKRAAGLHLFAGRGGFASSSTPAEATPSPPGPACPCCAAANETSEEANREGQDQTDREEAASGAVAVAHRKKDSATSTSVLDKPDLIRTCPPQGTNRAESATSTSVLEKPDLIRACEDRGADVVVIQAAAGGSTHAARTSKRDAGNLALRPGGNTDGKTVVVDAREEGGKSKTTVDAEHENRNDSIGAPAIFFGVDSQQPPGSKTNPSRVVLEDEFDAARRRHVAKNVEVLTESGQYFSFPRKDCRLLPIKHSTAEELAEYIWDLILCGLLQQLGITSLREVSTAMILLYVNCGMVIWDDWIEVQHTVGTSRIFSK